VRTEDERREAIAGIASFAALEARYGVVAAIGNHDVWFDREAVTQALQDAGIAVLWNRNIVIHRPGGEVVIAGIADAMTGHPDFEAALDGAPGAADAIVISHSPDPFAYVPARPALMLAAHTHCGQVTIPFAGRPMLPIHHEEFACGRAAHGAQTLYVTAGLGTSIVPVRFGNPPEIALITIRGAGPSARQHAPAIEPRRAGSRRVRRTGAQLRSVVHQPETGRCVLGSGVEHGRVTVNVEPAPSSLSTAIVPPWAATIDRAMYSPSPSPP
jgi:hypothetical protein